MLRQSKTKFVVIWIISIWERSLEKEFLDCDDLVGYIEGPPTMNGEPHAGHLRGRIIKDLWYRFNTLQKRK